MNFLIFRDFFGFFLNLYEFKIDLFNFYFRTGDIAASEASNLMINHDRRS